MANERLKELLALAQVYSQFQEPQLAQQQIAQRGQAQNIEAVLNLLNLQNQEARAAAEERYQTGQLNLGREELELKRAAQPLEDRRITELINASMAQEQDRARQTALDERRLGLTEQELGQQREAGQATRLVDLLQLLGSGTAAPITTEAVRGVPGMESLTRAVDQRAAQERSASIQSLIPQLQALRSGREALRPNVAQYPGAFEEAMAMAFPGGAPPEQAQSSSKLAQLFRYASATLKPWEINEFMEEITRR